MAKIVYQHKIEKAVIYFLKQFNVQEREIEKDDNCYKAVIDTDKYPHVLDMLNKMRITEVSMRQKTPIEIIGD